MADDDDYCGVTGTRVEPAAASAPAAGETGPAEGTFAECVLCQAPTEYAESYRGVTLCPVCEWLEAQRGMCGG
ncbi:hypothetical protein [Streptomyces sp. NPDC003006]